MKEERIPYGDIDGFCSSNTLKQVIHKDGDTIFETRKGKLTYVGLSEQQFKSSYCSCSNIYASHHTVVANILKKNYGYATKVIVEYYV